MGSNVQCTVAKVGIVKINVYNGTIRTLSSVHDVPDLKHDLISLVTFETMGCKYIAEDGVLKVSKATWTLLKGLRHKSLYVLQGLTTIGSLIVFTSAPNDIFTHVCHMWLD